MNPVVKAVVAPVEDEAYEYNSQPKLELNNVVESLNRQLMIIDWNNTGSGCQIEEIDQPGSSLSKDSCEMPDERSVVTGIAGPVALYSKSCTMHRIKVPMVELVHHRSIMKNKLFKFRRNSQRLRKVSSYYKLGIFDLIPDDLLHSVITVNNTEMVQRKLTEGVSPNIRYKNGRTPLHLASERGYTDIVRMLVKNGADPDCQDYTGATPLHLAIDTSKKLVVAVLLEAGANPLLRNEKNESALQLARMKLVTARSYNNDFMLHMTAEINDIINMLLVAINHRQRFGEQIDTLSNVCSRLTLSNTINQVKN